MINKAPPFKGLNVRIPILIPIQGRGFINHYITLSPASGNDGFGARGALASQELQVEGGRGNDVFGAPKEAGRDGVVGTAPKTLTHSLTHSFASMRMFAILFPYCYYQSVLRMALLLQRRSLVHTPRHHPFL